MYVNNKIYYRKSRTGWWSDQVSFDNDPIIVSGLLDLRIKFYDEASKEFNGRSQNYDRDHHVGVNKCILKVHNNFEINRFEDNENYSLYQYHDL